MRACPWCPSPLWVSLALTAIFAEVIAPHDPQIGVLGARFKPPFWQTGGTTEFLLGTDHLGRDVLSRLIFGARVSMVVGLTAVLIAGALGTTLGILSGYLGKWVDQVIMRITDTWLAFPGLVLAIFLAAVVGRARGTSSSSWPLPTGRGMRGSFAVRSSPSRSVTSSGWPSWPAARSGPSCAVTCYPTC